MTPDQPRSPTMNELDLKLADLMGFRLLTQGEVEALEKMAQDAGRPPVRYIAVLIRKDHPPGPPFIINTSNTADWSTSDARCMALANDLGFKGFRLEIREPGETDDDPHYTVRVKREQGEYKATHQAALRTEAVCLAYIAVREWLLEQARKGKTP